MKAFALDGFGEQGSVRDLPVPDPAEGQLSPRIAVAGVAGSRGDERPASRDDGVARRPHLDARTRRDRGPGDPYVLTGRTHWRMQVRRWQRSEAATSEGSW